MNYCLITFYCPQLQIVAPCVCGNKQHPERIFIFLIEDTKASFTSVINFSQFFLVSYKSNKLENCFWFVFDFQVITLRSTVRYFL